MFKWDLTASGLRSFLDFLHFLLGFYSFHFGLLNLPFLSFWLFGYWFSFAFILGLWVFIFFHFGLLGLYFLSFLSFGPSFPFILAFWAFISQPLGRTFRALGSRLRVNSIVLVPSQAPTRFVPLGPARASTRRSPVQAQDLTGSRRPLGACSGAPRWYQGASDAPLV